MTIQFHVPSNLVKYQEFVAQMEKNVAQVRDDPNLKIVYLLQHADVYTGGTSWHAEDILNPDIKVVNSSRGGKITYHGPGQLVIYPIFNLKSSKNIKVFLHYILHSISQALKIFGINAVGHQQHTGLWVDKNAYISTKNNLGINRYVDSSQNNFIQIDNIEEGEFLQNYLKIGFVGIKINRWVTYHGAAINIDPDLTKFAAIKPCGLEYTSVSSLKQCGYCIDMNSAIQAVKHFLSSNMPLLDSSSYSSRHLGI